jgi:small subunit ribosomal protein S3
MSKRVNPKVLRLGINRSHESQWFAKTDETYREFVKQDYMIRDLLSKKVGHAGLGEMQIIRPSKGVAIVRAEVARPGIVIGYKGKEIDALRAYLTKQLGITLDIDIKEIRNPEGSAACIARKLEYQLANRVQYRRAMKAAISSAMRSGVKGVSIRCKGRVSQIARSEKKLDGSVPLSTYRTPIDRQAISVRTKSGTIGVVVIVSKDHKRTQQEQAMDIPRRRPMSRDGDAPQGRRARHDETRSPSRFTGRPNDKPSGASRVGRAPR